jgi:aminoglycoside phosphotransferase (APT) family kinase protein
MSRDAAGAPSGLSRAVAPAVVGLDVAAVTAWIGGLQAGAVPPLTFARVGQGQSNLTFLVTDARGERWILRRPPLGHLLPSAHDVAREHRILRALQDTDVPSPAIQGFTDDPAVTDAPLLLMPYVDGLVVDDLAVAEGLAPQVRRRLGHALAFTLARVHAVDLEATGLATLASHKPYAARQLKRWRRQWEDSRTRDLPAVEALAERLEAATPEQHELTLVHGDFHLLNVIAAPDGSAVRAVLDWELCTLGDPLADLGGLLAYWPQAADAVGGVFPAPRLPGFPTRRELTETYARETGRDVAALAFWHALGLWKIAVICEGVRRRALDDARNAASGGVPPAQVVDDLVAQAQFVADDAGL